MKLVETDIQIGDYTFKYVQSAQVESTWEMLTDTATITVPRKLSFQGESIAQGESLFRKGDAVTIRSGYDGVLNPLFAGFISSIKPGTLLTFECQDAMWLCKQKTVTQSYKQVTLRELLTDISPIPFTAVDVSLGQFRITKATVAEVLEELRKTYGLYSWVRDGHLYAGLAYRAEDRAAKVFRFTHNIIDSDLEYERGDDVGIRVQAISMLPNNTKIEIEVGDPDGEQRTLHYYNLDEATLRETATREITRLKYEGYRGSFEAFGEPHVRHGDLAVIQDPTYPDREGTYLIRKVVYSTGTGGIRQSITLDRKV